MSNMMLPINIERSAFTRFLSMFVVLMMWLLSTFVLVVAIDYNIVRPHRDDKPSERVAAMCISMLFALPGMRQLQPGIPPVGCLVDVCGWYPNMVMISVAVLLSLAQYVGGYRPNMVKGGSSHNSNATKEIIIDNAYRARDTRPCQEDAFQPKGATTGCAANLV